MGASISGLHGFNKARGSESAKNSVAVIGDSTFMHSGITGLEDQLIFIIDDIINILVNNKPLLNFISKNLVMGALKSAFWAEDEGDKIFYERYLELVEADEHEYQDIDIMLFTILELAGSTGYNSILFEEPVSIEKYKPFLYRTVRLIIQSHRK